MFEHEDVANVSIVGVPDEEYGEQLCAWVSLHEGSTSKCKKSLEQSLRDHANKHMAYFKIPKFFLFRQEFPTTITGKVQKFACK